MRRSMVVAALLVASVVLLPETPAADVIRLKSGITVEGEITHQDERHVVVEVPEVGTFSVTMDRVEAIEESEVVPLEVLGDKLRALPGEIKDWPRGFRRQLEALGERSRELGDKFSVDNVKGLLKGADLPAVREALAKAQPSRIARVGWVALALALLGYGYVALCLQLIARKTGIRHGWMAWVPILNAFLTVRLGGRSLWWLAPLIVTYVVNQRIGSVVVLAFGLVVCLGIAEGRNKPFWVGLLLCVPIVNILALGYLAFSRAT